MGGFWDGTQRSASVGLTVRPSYRLMVDVGLQYNDVRLRTPQAHFVTTLVNVRTSYSFSTRTFLDSIVQYNADDKQFNVNLRFNIIHRPLSNLFVVYNQQQFADREGPVGRGLIVKYTHMLAF
jgi:hypothetical protein